MKRGSINYLKIKALLPIRWQRMLKLKINGTWMSFCVPFSLHGEAGFAAAATDDVATAAFAVCIEPSCQRELSEFHQQLLLLIFTHLMCEEVARRGVDIGQIYIHANL